MKLLFISMTSMLFLFKLGKGKEFCLFNLFIIDILITDQLTASVKNNYFAIWKFNNYY